MTDYTPGPWVHDGRGHVNKANGLSRICIAYGHSMPPGFNTGIPEHEQKANAELIASAPRFKEERDELLETLGNLFSTYTTHRADTDATYDSMEDKNLIEARATMEKIK